MSIFSLNKQRGICLTDKGLRAIGVLPTVDVPVIMVNWLKSDLRRRCESCGQMTYPGDFTDPPGEELGNTCLLCFTEIEGETPWLRE